MKIKNILWADPGGLFAKKAARMKDGSIDLFNLNKRNKKGKGNKEKNGILNWINIKLKQTCKNALYSSLVLMLEPFFFLIFFFELIFLSEII